MSLVADLHTIFDVSKYSCVCGNHHYPSIAPSTDIVKGTHELLCYKDSPPFSIGIVAGNETGQSKLNSSQFEHFLNLLSMLNQSHLYHYARWKQIIHKNNNDLNSCNCSFINDKFPFESKLLLRYFNSETELKSLINGSNYDVGYNMSINNENRPIGFAIVFDIVSDSGLEWKYSLRFNSSKTTDPNNKLDTFRRDLDALCSQSVQVCDTFFFLLFIRERAVFFGCWKNNHLFVFGIILALIFFCFSFFVCFVFRIVITMVFVNGKDSNDSIAMLNNKFKIKKPSYQKLSGLQMNNYKMIVV